MVERAGVTGHGWVDIASSLCFPHGVSCSRQSSLRDRKFDESRQRGWSASPIIDHDDTTPNFENTGRTPYLYFTRFNGTTISDAGLNRDLVRVPVIITAH